MKDKIFNKLKQAYTPLGLGDAILLEHAGALASTGLVTDDNIDAVVAGQKNFLEQLQRSNDKRVQDAIASAKVKDKEAADAAAAEAARLAEEARNKAIEETRAAERAAVVKEMEEKFAKEKAEAEKKAAEARRKAEEEAERKAQAAKNEIPEWYTRDRSESVRAFEEHQRQMAEMQKAYTDQLNALREQQEKAAKERQEQFAKHMDETNKARQEQQKIIDALMDENNRIKAEAHRKTRMDFINNKAKDMGIPQYRIDEGFAGIGENSSDDEIVSTLSNVAKNVKANQLPEKDAPYALGGNEPSKGEIESLAKLLTKN